MGPLLCARGLSTLSVTGRLHLSVTSQAPTEEQAARYRTKLSGNGSTSQTENHQTHSVAHDSVDH